MASLTRLWMIRHALVAQNERLRLYGSTDVPLCPDSLVAQVPTYRALAARLPRGAAWVVTPLSRTRLTAQAIQSAGYPETPLAVEPALIEQSMGDWHGVAHDDLPPKLQGPAHPFWPLAATERPPGGESITDVIARVGPALERLAAPLDGERDVVVVSHGGAIRAAVAHAMGVDGRACLHLSVQNLSLTVLERLAEGWRVVCVNEVVEG